MRLYIARHGSAKKDIGPKGFPQVLGGAKEFDRGLDEKGSREAVELGYVLSKAGLRLDAVYASGLKRAYETAVFAIAASHHGVVGFIHLDDRLNERHFGRFSGMFCDEMVLQPGFNTGNILCPWVSSDRLEDVIYNTGVPLASRVETTNIVSINSDIPGVLEPVKAIMDRLGYFEDDLKRRHRDDDHIAVFCHGDVIKCWMQRIVELSDRYRPETVKRVKKMPAQGLYRKVSHCDVLEVWLR